MQRLNDWDTTRAAMGGEGMEQVTPGGHVVKILNASIGEYNGKEQLILCFDVDEGTEFDGIFRRQFDIIKKRGDGTKIPQWPINGTFKQFTRDYNDSTKTNPYFKGLIQAVCDSNARYVWDWNERSLVGKYVGLIFREEEYATKDTGEIRTTVRAFACCPAADAPDKEPPKKKEYKGPRPQGGAATGTATAATNTGFTDVPEDDLPFE